MYSQIYGFIKAINNAAGDTVVTKEDLCRQFSNGRTDSLRNMLLGELVEMKKALATLAPKPSAGVDMALDKPRKAIIAIFRSMGKTPDEAKRWAEENGCDGHKKAFNSYTGQELFKLIRGAEKLKEWYINKASK